MPPKAKFTKEEITATALDIIRTQGSDNLTARALGTKLNSSARPIFTVFRNMDEVKQSAINAARQLYDSYVNNGLNQTEMPAFKGVGMQYIRFAIIEPKLFQVLFMTEQTEIPNIKEILPIIDDNYSKILYSVQNCYGLSKADSERLYRHLWIYTHGIAALCATNICSFTTEEISLLLTDVCSAVISKIKAGEKND